MRCIFLYIKIQIPKDVSTMKKKQVSGISCLKIYLRKPRPRGLFNEKGISMEKKINNILFVTTRDGEQLTFKVLFTYHSENFGKDYVVFYNEQDENHLLAYAYDENSTLYDIETAEEGNELERALQAFDEEQAAKGDQNNQ